MAVTRYANVIKVPSADAGTTMLVPWSGDQKQPTRIVGVRWVGGTTDAHTAVLQDVDGNVIWESQMDTTNVGQDQESVIPIRSRGVKATTISSGTVYIYLCDE